MQHTQTAAVHYAKANDEGHTVCGRKKGAGLPYRFVPSPIDVPDSMLCECCLPTEKAIATDRDEFEVNGDE